MIEKQEKIILICDHQGEHIDRVVQLLHESQYKVIFKADPRKILETCIDNPVVALVLEIQLLKDLELLQTLNKRPQTKHLPIIITTKEKQHQKRIKYMNLGIDDFVPKPYYPEELVTRIENLVLDFELTLPKKLSHSFLGNLEEMNLLDIAQTMELAKKSGSANLSRANQSGEIFFQNGRIVDAILEGFTPLNALFNMMAWTIGTFCVSLEAINRPTTILVESDKIFSRGEQILENIQKLAKFLPAFDMPLIANAKGKTLNFSKEEIKILDFFIPGATIFMLLEKSHSLDLVLLKTVKNLWSHNHLTRQTHKQQNPVIAQPAKEDNPPEDRYTKIISFFKKNTKNTDTLNSNWPETLMEFKPQLAKSDLFLIKQKLSKSLSNLNN